MTKEGERRKKAKVSSLMVSLEPGLKAFAVFAKEQGKIQQYTFIISDPSSRERVNVRFPNGKEDVAILTQDVVGVDTAFSFSTTDGIIVEILKVIGIVKLTEI